MGDRLCKGLEAANNVNMGTSIVAFLADHERARGIPSIHIEFWLATAALALWLGASLPAAMAQSDDFVNGQVTKIDQSAGKITIKHGPLKKFDMNESMTMVVR